MANFSTGYICKYKVPKDPPAMLAVKRLAEVNLRNDWGTASMQEGGSIPTLKPRTDVARSPKQGPHKKGHGPTGGERTKSSRETESCPKEPWDLGLTIFQHLSFIEAF